MSRPLVGPCRIVGASCGCSHGGAVICEASMVTQLPLYPAASLPASPYEMQAPGRASTSDSSGSSTEQRDMCARFEKWEEWDSQIPLWKHAFAGSCAGVMEHIGMYPLDTIKTHMQALRPTGGSASLAEILREIGREHGGLGFMRGWTAIAGGCIPAHIAMFTSYELSKQRLSSGSGEHEPIAAAICGATANICHDLILTPMDLVKQRMQLGRYEGIGHCLQSVMRQEGLRALFRSMPTTIVMNIPFGSVLVATNESLKVALDLDKPASSTRSSSQRLFGYFAVAGVSGAVASCMTQPLDVVKTRLQTQDCLIDSGGASASSVAGREACLKRPKYSGFISTVTTIVREEGTRALFRGAVPRMVHATPAAALCWGTYEAVKSAL